MNHIQPAIFFLKGQNIHYVHPCVPEEGLGMNRPGVGALLSMDGSTDLIAVIVGH